MRLAVLTPDNIAAACAIRLRAGQERFVAPVAESIAEAYVSPAAWPRVIEDDGRVVGFVMASFDPDNEIPAFRAGIWRLAIAAVEQGKGYDRFAVDATASLSCGSEARAGRRSFISGLGSYQPARKCSARSSVR